MKDCVSKHKKLRNLITLIIICTPCINLAIIPHKLEAPIKI